jgi:hypothetical protein
MLGDAAVIETHGAVHHRALAMRKSIVTGPITQDIGDPRRGGWKSALTPVLSNRVAPVRRDDDGRGACTAKGVP